MGRPKACQNPAHVVTGLIFKHGFSPWPKNEPRPGLFAKENELVYYNWAFKDMLAQDGPFSHQAKIFGPVHLMGLRRRSQCSPK